MKIKFFALALAALTLLACEKTPDPIVPEETDYVGTLVVESSKGPVENTEARVKFQPNQDGSAELTLYEVKFSPGMPMKLDVTIPDVKVTSTANKITLSGTDIIPLALGGNKFPDHIVTDLTGEIVGDKMTLSLKFGGIPTTYVGEK